MRGKVISTRITRIKIGITPAYAGKRTALILQSSLFEDHPRLCGEKSRCGSAFWGFLGSPPPMRGKANAGHMNELQNRITPAYAGKRNYFRKMNEKEKDHPRLCGEKASSAASVFPVSGSPPPMRGKG